jgi:hypothetical protein
MNNINTSHCNILIDCSFGSTFRFISLYERQLQVSNIIQESSWQVMQSTEFNIIPEFHVNM